MPLPYGYPGPIEQLCGGAWASGMFAQASSPIAIPAIGLTLWERKPPAPIERAVSMIETVHAPGFGPPLHRHPETEVFRVLRGRYVMKGGLRVFEAKEGDVITVPGGVAHAFMNAGDEPASQLVLIMPALDVDGFFRGLADVMKSGKPETRALAEFGKQWNVDFLGPPLKRGESLAAPL